MYDNEELAVARPAYPGPSWLLRARRLPPSHPPIAAVATTGTSNFGREKIAMKAWPASRAPLATAAAQSPYTMAMSAKRHRDNDAAEAAGCSRDPERQREHDDIEPDLDLVRATRHEEQNKGRCREGDAYAVRDRHPLLAEAARLRADQMHVAAASQRHEPAGDAVAYQSVERAPQRAVERQPREVEGSPRAEAESGKACRDKVGTGQDEQCRRRPAAATAATTTNEVEQVSRSSDDPNSPPVCACASVLGQCEELFPQN